MLILVFFLFGVVIGSFLNVFILRWVKEEQWVTGRSHCMNCAHELASSDLVPVLSWLWLRGRCRYCHSPISWRYPMIEIVNGLLWAAVALGAGAGVTISGIGTLGLDISGLVVSVVLMCFLSILLVIFVIDMEHYLIPDETEIAILVLGLIILFVGQGPGALERLYAGGIGLGFLGGLHLITRGKGMGLGDVKLAGALGVLMGYWSLIGLAFAFWAGAIVGIILLVLGKAKMRRPIPFGPFMVVGIVIVLLMGHRIQELMFIW